MSEWGPHAHALQGSTKIKVGATAGLRLLPGNKCAAGLLCGFLSEWGPLLHSLQGGTKIKVGATAGLRLLPDNKADLILEAVTAYLQKSPFALDSVTVLDGAACPWGAPSQRSLLSVKLGIA